MPNLRNVTTPPRDIVSYEDPENLAGKIQPEDLENIVEIFQTPLTGAYNWDYETANEKLMRLYELGKQLNWNAQKDIDWQIPRIPRREKPADETMAIAAFMGWEPFERLSEEEKTELNWHVYSWMLSQFLHGEQGALLVASQLVSCAPTEEAKLYAASQTFDEARHVEVFHRYIKERVGFMYPIDTHLKVILDKVLTDPRWDLKFLGMQIIIEGLALSAFQTLQLLSYDPVLKQMTEYVNRDEARHVGFGVIFLEEFLKALSSQETENRAQFAYETCVLMRERLIPTDVVQRFGFPYEEARQRILETEVMQLFRELLFERIIPNLKKIGLLTPSVRPKYDALGILKFEDLGDDGQIDWAEISRPYTLS